MRSRPRWMVGTAAPIVMMAFGTTRGWAPKHRSINRPAIPNRPVAHKDFCPVRWTAAGLVAASTLVFSPLPSLAAEQAAAKSSNEQEVTITLTLPRSVIKSLEDNTGSKPTISIKIAEEELLEKANKPPVSATPAPAPATTTTEAPKPITEQKTEDPKANDVEKKPVEAPPVPVVKSEAPKPPTVSDATVEKKLEPGSPKTEAPKPATVAAEQKPEAPPIEKKVEPGVVKKEEPEPPKASAVAPEKKPDLQPVETKAAPIAEPSKAVQPKPEEVKKPEIPKQETKKEESPKPAPPKTPAASKPPKTVDASLLDRKIQTTVQKKMNGKEDTNLVLSTGEIVGISAIGVALLAAVSSALSKDKNANDTYRRPRSNTGGGGSLARRVNGDYINGSNNMYSEGSPGYNTKEPSNVEYFSPDTDEFGYPRQETRSPTRQQQQWQQQKRIPDRKTRTNDYYYPNDYQGSGYNSREPHRYKRPDEKEPKVRPATNPRDGPNGRRLRRSNRSYMDDYPEGGYNDKEPW